MKHPRIIIRWFVGTQRHTRLFTDEAQARVRAAALDVLGFPFEVIRL